MKTVQCKRCGTVNLAWVKSERTGRYYLAPVRKYHGFVDNNGRATGGGSSVSKHHPHKCDPAAIEKFQTEVAGYAAARGVTIEEWWQGK
jgi:hypothetical protein